MAATSFDGLAKAGASLTPFTLRVITAWVLRSVPSKIVTPIERLPWVPPSAGSSLALRKRTWPSAAA